ncbi:MAG: GNAT family N-acetyltransferase [Candidatus Dormiibacterota bacterium]
MLLRVKIAECREVDVELLDSESSLRGTSFHAGRYARQQLGRSTVLVAWLGRQPVGSCEIRWDGCGAEEVRVRHSDCPEINGLGVWPEAMRSRGVGTALIRAAERAARARPCHCIGLGVETTNVRAATLYARLGYRPTVAYVDRWSFEDSGGATHYLADACRFMVKEI